MGESESISFCRRAYMDEYSTAPCLYKSAPQYYRMNFLALPCVLQRVEDTHYSWVYNMGTAAILLTGQVLIIGKAEGWLLCGS